MSAIKHDDVDTGANTGMGAIRELHLDASELVEQAARPSGPIPVADAPSQTVGTPAVSAIGPSRGGLRIGGVPAAMGRAATVRGEDVLASLAQLEAEIAQLRGAAEERDRTQIRAEADVRRDIASVKGSIETVEAYLAIHLPAKIDQLIGEKLTVVHRLEAARRRTRFWLVALLYLNALVVGAGILEVYTGAVLPLGREALTLLQNAASGFQALVADGLARLRS